MPLAPEWSVAVKTARINMRLKLIGFLVILGTGGYAAYPYVTKALKEKEFALPLAWTAAFTGKPKTARPPAGQKPCFACESKGKAACTASGCQHGQADCPAPCLKTSQGKWEHLEVAGHPPGELWQKFYYGGGSKSKAWDQAHVGEVIEMRDGEPANIGKCKTCGGTTRARCATCGGTGELPCETCESRGFVPEAWTASNNPKRKSPLSAFVFKDGRQLRGKISMQVGRWVSITTVDGKKIEASLNDIVSGGSGGSVIAVR